MRKHEQGFTLIELVVVITILGILAAVALPRFAQLQSEARLAKINGALGAIKSGAVMAHAAALTQGATLSGAGTINIEGVNNLAIYNGYPTAATIATAAGVASTDFTLGTPSSPGTGSGKIRVDVDSTHNDCSVTYNEAPSNGVPTYTFTSAETAAALTSANCS